MMECIRQIRRWVDSKINHYSNLHALNSHMKEGDLHYIFYFVDEITFITRNGLKGKITRQDNEDNVVKDNIRLFGKIELRNQPCKHMVWDNRGKYIKMNINPHHIHDISKIIGYTLKK